MNRIIQSHLQSFQTTSGLEDLAVEDAFERFINYCIGYKHTGTSPDVSSITTGDPDAGIDGVICLVDNEIVTTVDECSDVFQRGKRNLEAKLVFTQATSTEAFSKAKFASFTTGVYDFLQTKPASPHDDVLKEHHKIFDLIIKNANKVAGGKPACELYYAATGRYNRDVEIEGAKESARRQIDSLELFSSVSIHFLDADSLLRLWLECSQTISSAVDVVGTIPLPKTQKIPEAYLALVGAKELVTKLLLNEANELRVWAFNENVRAFLGGGNPVNAAIQGTISNAEAKARFALLNNGITIVSPDIRVQGGTISLNGFQIVNGCQTSSVLFEKRHELTDDVTVAVKFIEADDPDVVAEIVRATNKQTKVEDSQFLALEPLAKRIEAYFKSYQKSEKSQALYFERRFRQYQGEAAPLIRTFDIKTACKAVGAMFLNKPDLAMRYPNQMLKDLHDSLFDERNKEIIYYAACLGLWRINLLISNAKLPSNFRRMKWHLLYASRIAVGGARVPQLSSSSVEKYCDGLISVFSKSNPLSETAFANAVEVIRSMAGDTRDRLTRKNIAHDIQEAVLAK